MVAERSSTSHRFVVPNLPHKRQLTYQISIPGTDDQQKQSFSLDTHFNWAPFPPKETLRQPIISQLANPRGMAVVVGKENIELAKRLVTQSKLTVLLHLKDESLATKIRQKWIQQEPLRYGQRIAVVTNPLDQFPGAFAQLVIVPEKGAVAADKAIRRLVRPSGGILSDGRKIIWRRKKLIGAGEWTHMYGLPNNSAYGGEHLGNASNREDLVANWIGRPGPRYQTDRQNRKPSPLASNGRLYLQGHQRLIALDSFSGSILWSVETPDRDALEYSSRRVQLVC